MLPDTDGYDVLSRMRSAGLDMPVVILTARGEEVDKVRGFRTGADDYVTKPFGVMELLVRIHAILRRGAPRVTAKAGAREAGNVRRVGPIEVDVIQGVFKGSGFLNRWFKKPDPLKCLE